MREAVTVMICGGLGAGLAGYATATILYLRSGTLIHALGALAGATAAGGALGAGAALWALP